MPLSPRKRRHNDHQSQLQPLPDPHPLRSNSVRPNSMRRPNFLLKRQRSNSVPNLAFADVSAEEAGIIFSAAERAASRRRRPLSEYSPGPSSLLAAEPDETTPTDLATSSTTAPRPGSPDDFPPSRWHLDHERSRGRLSTVREARCSVSSSSSVVDLDDGSSIGSIEEPISPLTTSSIPPETPLPQSASSERLVAKQTLKDYADSMFIFTQSCLDNAVPNRPIDLSLLAPHVKVDSPTLQPRELEESGTNRPLLRSHFSDWSLTTMEMDADGSEPFTRWSSSVHTPCDSHIQTPDEYGMMSPDSFFAEVTPRVVQSLRWTDTVSSSPTWNSRASSPTRGSLRYLSSASLPTDPSPAPSEGLSYFSGFDGHTAAAEAQLDPSFGQSTGDSLRSLSTSGSLLARRNSLAGARPASSSAPNAMPLLRRDASPKRLQMADVSVSRPVGSSEPLANVERPLAPTGVRTLPVSCLTLSQPPTLNPYLVWTPFSTLKRPLP